MFSTRPCRFVDVNYGCECSRLYNRSRTHGRRFNIVHKLGAPRMFETQRIFYPRHTCSTSQPFPPEDMPSPVLVSVSTACMGALAFGYHLAIVNGSLEASSGDLGFGHSTSLQGLIVSSLLAGAALGSLAGGVLADYAGRRRALLAASVPMLVGPFVCATAASLNGMVFGRLVTGVGVGLSSSLVPTYIAEIAPTESRGTCGSLNQLMICTGILLALLANVLLDPAQHWRATFAMSSVPAFALFLGMLLWCVDSPSDVRVHSQVAGRVRTTSSPPASQLKPSPPRRMIGVWLGCALFLCQQLSGINAVIYFSSRIFQEAGVGGPSGAVIASIAVGVFNIIGTLLVMAVIEKVGRRSLLIASYAGMAATMCLMGVSFVVPLLKTNSKAITLVGTAFFVLAFAIGAGPVTGLLVPELNDARTRGLAMSSAMVTHWVANIAVGQSFLPAAQTLGLSGVYLCFSAFAALAALFVSRSIPETRGRSFEQIQIDLSHKQVNHKQLYTKLPL